MSSNKSRSIRHKAKAALARSQVAELRNSKKTGEAAGAVHPDSTNIYITSRVFSNKNSDVHAQETARNILVQQAFADTQEPKNKLLSTNNSSKLSCRKTPLPSTDDKPCGQNIPTLLFHQEWKLVTDGHLFSVDGGEFNMDLFRLAACFSLSKSRRAIIAAGYDLVCSVYPENGVKMRNSLPRVLRQQGPELYGHPPYAKVASKDFTTRKKSSPARLPPPDSYKRPSTKYTLVDSLEKIEDFLAVVTSIQNHNPDLFCDCEGDNLSRLGTLSTLQVKIASVDHTFVLDVTVLGRDVVDVQGPDGRTFKHFLEDQSYPKIFYDCRNDSDAIFAHLGVHMKGVIDLQILELAVRFGSRSRRLGLSDCILSYCGPSMHWEEKAIFQYDKQHGKDLCRGDNGYKIYDMRPLPPALLWYAVGDVECLPSLLNALSTNLSAREELKKRVLDLSQEIATNSTLENYDPNNNGRSCAPKETWSWTWDMDH